MGRVTREGSWLPPQPGVITRVEEADCLIGLELGVSGRLKSKLFRQPDNTGGGNLSFRPPHVEVENLKMDF